MTPQELKNSILQRAIQGKLVEQRPEEDPVSLVGLKCKVTEEYEFDLPEGWIIGHIETITVPIPTKQYQILESQVSKEGKYPVISQSKDYSIGFTNVAEKLFSHDDPVVIFGDHTTVVKLVDFDFVVGADGVKIFSPVKDVVLAGFLYYILQFFTYGLDKVGGYSRHYKYIKDKAIPLPPLAEQKRIVAKIEELLPLIDRYEAAYTRLEEFNKRFPGDMQKSLLQMAIQGKLVEQRPEEGTGEELFQQIQAEKQALIRAGKIKKDKPLPEITDDEKPFDIPESWKWVRLGNITSFQGGYAFKSTSYVPQSDNQVVRLGNVKPNSLLLDVKQVFIPDDIACQAKDYQLKKDDILVTMTGTRKKRDYFFTLSICESDLFQRNLYLNQRVGCLRAYRSIYIKYLLVVLQNEGIKDLIFAKETGTANQGNIGSEDMKQFVFIPLPPLAEQKRIVAKLEELLPLCERLK